LTLHKPNGGINDGFGREAMVFAVFEPKDIASQVKRAYLAPTVRQKFVAPHRTFITWYKYSAASPSPKISLSFLYLSSTALICL
jgi:hypothetical protein